MPLTILKRAQVVPNQGGAGQAAGTLVVNRPSSSLWDGTPDPLPSLTPETPFTGDGYTISAELYRATIGNALVEDISDYLTDGSITMDLGRDIVLTASLTIRNPGIVTPYVDYLAPFVRIAYDDGTPDVYQQVGLFATVTPPGTYGPNDSVGTFACDDLCRVLADYMYTDSSSSAAGTTYTGQIGGTISNGGISRYGIPASTATLPTAQTWPIKTSRLQKANTLLDQLGWYHLSTTLDGRVTTPGLPQDLAGREPWRTLTDADVMSVVDVTPAGQRIANVVLVINNDSASAPLSSTARNDDPASPTSTVAIGREIMRIESVSGSTTQAALDALAARYLAESRTQYRTVKLTIVHDPTALNPYQNVALVLTGTWATFSGTWRITSASMGFTPDKATVLTLNQVTDDTTGATV